MTAGGIPLGRIVVYGAAALLLIGLNIARYTWNGTRPAETGLQAPNSVSDLPDLAVLSDFNEVADLPRRNLFRADIPAPPAPPPEPEPEPQPAAALDPEAQSRTAAERTLDSIDVIGFLSTGDGIVAVLKVNGSIVNVLEGDRPAAGFLASGITIDSVTLTHAELGLKRTYGLNDAD
ncbi:hypothetical protein [Roseibium sp.]|uniref:hypothetical protein n=1 Tax=Roseibium sp. TaxID=1936156 RepID=UPI003D125CBE